MTPCTHCGTLIRRGACPTCGSPIARRFKTPARMAILGLTLLVGCETETQPEVSALYGVPACATDADDDGSCADADCDDNDPDRYPGAAETAGDGVDSNCDGEDDT